MSSSSGSRDESLGSRIDNQRSEREIDQMLSALGDSACRNLLCRLTDGPLTAEELSRASGIPSSTLYRKLEKLIKGDLVAKGTEISTGGRNATLYEQRIDGVSIRIDGTDDVEVETTKGPEQTDETSESV